MNPHLVNNHVIGVNPVEPPQAIPIPLNIPGLGPGEIQELPLPEDVFNEHEVLFPENPPVFNNNNPIVPPNFNILFLDPNDVPPEIPGTPEIPTEAEIPGTPEGTVEVLVSDNTEVVNIITELLTEIITEIIDHL